MHFVCKFGVLTGLADVLGFGAQVVVSLDVHIDVFDVDDWQLGVHWGPHCQSNGRKSGKPEEAL